MVLQHWPPTNPTNPTNPTTAKALDRLGGPGGADGPPTAEFLAACKCVLPVVDSLGAGMVPARADISGNIARLEARLGEDPAAFGALFAIVRREKRDGCEADNAGCTKGLLWLTRALTFILETLRRLHADPALEVHGAASAAYEGTLKPYHGWITSTAYWAALKLVPYRRDFFAILGEGSAGLDAELARLDAQLSPVLAAVRAFMEAEGVNFPDTV